MAKLREPHPSVFRTGYNPINARSGFEESHVNRTRARRGTLAAVTATTAMLLTGGTAYADLSPGELHATTDRYLFEISLDEFVVTRDAQPHPEQLDWSSDSCSLSPNEPLGYEFTSSCDRHDFGYRNYQQQARFTEDNRQRIDDNFKADMYSNCDDDTGCEVTANVYHWAVREFGSVSTSTAEAIEKAQITQGTTPSGKIAEVRATARDGQAVEFEIG